MSMRRERTILIGKLRPLAKLIAQSENTRGLAAVFVFSSLSTAIESGEGERHLENPHATLLGRQQNAAGAENKSERATEWPVKIR